LKALRIGEEKVSDKAIESSEKRVARISEDTDASRKDATGALIDSFVEDKNWEHVSLTEGEIEKAEKLADETFRSKEWNQKL